MDSKMAIRIAYFSATVLCCVGDLLKIRKNNEPYLYKTIHIGYPAIHPSEIPSQRELNDKKSLMMTGTASEDLIIDTNSKISSRASQLLQLFVRPTPIEEAEDTLNGLLKVMNETKAQNEPLMSHLTLITEEIKTAKSAGLLDTSTSGGTKSNEKSARDFIEKVEMLLEASGIEAVLPLDCGRNPHSPSTPLDNNPLPWIAALGSKEDGRFYYRCTGAIITPYHIITDAECANSPNINVVQLNVTSFVPEPSVVEDFVVGRRIHPSITNDESLLDGNNVGILELAHELKFDDYVQPICLPGVFVKTDPDDVYTTTVVGFGDINDSPQGRFAELYTRNESRTLGAAFCFSDIKRSNKRNPDKTSNLFSIITKKHFCIDRPFEDIGKSIVVKEDAETRRVQLIGVGPIANAQITKPIVYTLIQPHRFWIELVLKKFFDNTEESEDDVLAL